MFFLLFKTKGIIEPLEFKTFPYLTILNFVEFFPAIAFASINIFSAQSFVAPYKFIGLTALSVERAITFFTLLSIAAETILLDPVIFVLINSRGLYSAIGTCFKAAA